MDYETGKNFELLNEKLDHLIREWEELKKADSSSKKKKEVTE